MQDLEDPQDAVEWLLRWKLLKPSQECRRCGDPMNLWTNLRVGHGDRRRKSPAIEADVNRETVMSFYRKIRSELMYLDQYTGSMIGGPGKTVEIDETKLIKRK
uniref:Transposase n=1 Tax=Anopheles melas TaxID=34690 RepID=A0A182UGR2_9DIPT